MPTTYTISTDRKTVTVSLANAIPTTSADDHVIEIFIEEANGAITARYISSDVVGVIRSYIATQVNSAGQPLYANVEALVFAQLEQMFQANVVTHYPPSVQTALAGVTVAQAALQTAIANVVAELVTL